jgi:hypothetical protein
MLYEVGLWLCPSQYTELQTNVVPSCPSLSLGVNKVTWDTFFILVLRFYLSIAFPPVLHIRLWQCFRRAKGCTVQRVNRISPIGWDLFKTFLIENVTRIAIPSRACRIPYPCYPPKLIILICWAEIIHYEASHCAVPLILSVPIYHIQTISGAPCSQTSSNSTSFDSLGLLPQRETYWGQRDLRYSSRCWWRFIPSQMLRCGVEWAVSNASRELRSLETSGTIYPTTQCGIPEDVELLGVSLSNCVYYSCCSCHSWIF